MSAVHVLHLIRTLDPSIGGPLTYVTTIGAAMRHSPVRISIAALSAPGGSAPPRETVFPGTAGSAPLRALRLRAWLTQALADVDVVHIHGIFGWQVLLGAWHCARAGIPYVVTTHGNLHPYALSQKRWRKWLYLQTLGRLVFSRAAVVLATGAFEVRDAARVAPYRRIRIVRPAVSAPEDVRPKAGVSDALEVLFIGRLHPHKGLTLLIDAVAKLCGRGRAVSLSLAGEGEPAYEAVLREQVHRLGLDGAVTFHGFLGGERKWAALRASHVLALPSYSENFSFAVAEALACGVPVVTTSEVGLSELVVQERCGRVVAPGDVDALAAALAEFADEGVRCEAAVRAWHCAAEHLTIARMREDLLALYRGLTAAARQPGSVRTRV